VTDDEKYDEIYFNEMRADDTTSFVSRHDTGIPREESLDYIRYYTRSLKSAWDSLPKMPGNLVGFATDAWALAGYTHLATPDAPEIMPYLRLVARGIAAAAARTIPDSGPVCVELGEFGPIEIPPARKLPIRGLNLREIVHAYYAALATQDALSVQLLARVPLEPLLASSGALLTAPYALPHARGLQMMFNGERGGLSLLVKTHGTWRSPDLPQALREDGIFLVGPEIELALFHKYTDEEAREVGRPTFDRVLRMALVDHRWLWNVSEPNPGRTQTRDPEGFIALGPLAFAAQRYRRGLPVNITSGYLPRSVIEAPPI